MTSLKQLNETILKVSNFLVPLLPLASCHMVDYISANHWENLLPEQIRKDLLDLPREKLQHLPSASIFMENNDNLWNTEWKFETSDLASYLSAIRHHSLESLGVLTPIDKIFKSHGPDEVTTLPMKGVMSEKKSHEVEVMSQAIARLAKGCGVDWIVDLGSGKGYLSTSLVLQYNLNVLAIDSSQENTSSAVIRKRKLQKYWKIIKKTEMNRLLGIPVKKGKHRRKRIKPTDECKLSGEAENTNDIGKLIAVTAFITEDTNLSKTVKDSIESEVNDLKESIGSLSLTDTPQTNLGSLSVTDNPKTDVETLSLKNITHIDTLQSQSMTVNDSHSISEKNNVNIDNDTNVSIQISSANIIKENTQINETKAFGNIAEVTSENSTEAVDPIQNSQLPLDPKCKSPEDYTLGLVGLHTCGNLAPSSLKLFLSNPSVNLLCNVGCCYHLIEEEFSKNPFIDYNASSPGNLVKISRPLLSHVDENSPYKQDKNPTYVDDENSTYKQREAFVNPMHPSKIPNLNLGFPLSETLRSRGFYLGRNSRMLSCQPADRLNCQDLNSSRSLYWRSLLQVLLRDKFGDVSDMAHVGRIAAKCQTFSEYVQMAFTKIGIDLEIEEEELRNYDKKYGGHIQKLEKFYLLRGSLAPIIEGLILLDRFAFLYEQGIESSYLVQLFDPVKSPRSHALIAFRKNVTST